MLIHENKLFLPMYHNEVCEAGPQGAAHGHGLGGGAVVVQQPLRLHLPVQHQHPHLPPALAPGLSKPLCRRGWILGREPGTHHP